MNRVLPYVPQIIARPNILPNVPSEWIGVESILFDVIERFKIAPRKALQFGVENGYSVAALANMFIQVAGVVNPREDAKKIRKALGVFYNIDLLEIDPLVFFALSHSAEYDVISIDMVETYREAKKLAAWAIDHSRVVMIHDIISHVEVLRAVQDIAWETGRVFYQYLEGHGVGFLVKE